MVTTTNTLYIVGSGARLFSLSPPGGHDMKVILREDTSGVSEVIGTILILSMTVVLFSVIIIWVGSIPTPVAQSRLDLRSQMDPIYNGAGVEVGVNITLTHQGGEAIAPVPTIIYVTSQRGANPPTTTIFTLHKYNLVLGNGLLDGTDSVWDIGERWNYNTPALRSSDAITVTIRSEERRVGKECIARWATAH